MNRKTAAVVLIAALITTIGSVAADQAGVFNITGGNNNITNSNNTITDSNVTIGANNTITYLTPTDTPIQQNLQNDSNNLLQPTASPAPTPIPPATVNVIATEYGNTTNEPAIGNTFVCVVTVNSTAYDSLLIQLASQNMTVLSTPQTSVWFSNFGINTGASVVSNIGNGQFTLTLTVASSPNVQYNVVNIQSAVADGCNTWLYNQSP